MTTQPTTWNKKMTIAEMLPLMSDAEINRNARKGGVAAIEEQKRRRAPPAPEMSAGGLNDWYIEHIGIFRTQAEILGDAHRCAGRIAPDPELDLGV